MRVGWRVVLVSNPHWGWVARTISLVGVLILAACASPLVDVPSASGEVSVATSLAEGSAADVAPALEDLEVQLPPPIDQSRFTSENPPAFSDYEEAVLATVACIEAMGHEVWGPALASEPDFPFLQIVPGVSGSHVYSWAIPDPAPGSTPAMGGEAADDFCRKRYLERIQILFLSPTEEEIRAWYDQFRDCLEGEGFDVSGRADEQLIDVVDWPRECLP